MHSYDARDTFFTKGSVRYVLGLFRLIRSSIMLSPPLAIDDKVCHRSSQVIYIYKPLMLSKFMLKVKLVRKYLGNAMLVGHKGWKTDFPRAASVDVLHSTNGDGRQSYCKKSKWLFQFYRINNQIVKEKAVCRICNQEYKYTGGTTNLNHHLQKYHKEIFENMKRKTEVKKTVQSQLTSLMRQPIRVTAGSPKFHSHNEAIAEFLIGSLVPLSTVDTKEFRKRISTISGDSYDPPFRKYFTETLLPKMMEDTTQQLIKDLGKIRGCGITTDEWTSNDF